MHARVLFAVGGVDMGLCRLYRGVDERKARDDIEALPLLVRRTLQTRCVEGRGEVPVAYAIAWSDVRRAAFVVRDVSRWEEQGVFQVAPRAAWQASDHNRPRT